MKTNTKKGFSLIELLVVIVIIGILATLGISAYSKYISKAQDTTKLAVVQQIATAIEASQEGSLNYSYDFTAAANTDCIAVLKGVFHNGDTNYYYYYNTAATEYQIASCKSDGTTVIKEGNSDEAGTCSNGVFSITASGTGTLSSIECN